MSVGKKTLIIQGGGFRTGFSTGVLDSFQATNHNDFDLLIGISGGAIAMSYYLSEQPIKCFEAMCLLAVDKKFMNYSSLMTKKGMMNIDYFHEVAGNIFPLDVNKAMENSINKKLAIVLTERSNGLAHYYRPSKKTWIDAVIDSCTLPFVTKGKHSLQGVEYFDGGWSDPLPAQWAYNHGSRDLTLIRTAQKDTKVNQSWPDYLAAIYNRRDQKMKDIFEANHTRYNNAIDFLNNPPNDLKIAQIAPESPLKTGTYSNSIKSITADYDYGKKCGMAYLKSLEQQKKLE